MRTMPRRRRREKRNGGMWWIRTIGGENGSVNEVVDFSSEKSRIGELRDAYDARPREVTILLRFEHCGGQGDQCRIPSAGSYVGSYGSRFSKNTSDRHSIWTSFSRFQSI